MLEWHIPIVPRFCLFLAVQLGRTIVHFTVFPFSLNIAPKISTKMTKLVAQAHSHLDVEIILYLDDWLIQALDCLKTGFLFILSKFCFTLPS